MKIAQVLYRYYPYIGGVEAVVKETSEVMVRKGVHVEVLTQDRTGNLPPIEEINGVVIRRFRTGALGWDFALRKGSLRNYLLRNSSEFDLVHAHTCHTFCPLYAAWAKGENRLVINTHYHGVGHDRLMNLLHRPYRRVVKAALGKADKVVCVSETEGLIVKIILGYPTLGSVSSGMAFTTTGLHGRLHSQWKARSCSSSAGWRDTRTSTWQ
jgi:glycosyltransferase involved in cell wall biosynthesis